MILFSKEAYKQHYGKVPRILFAINISIAIFLIILTLAVGRDVVSLYPLLYGYEAIISVTTVIFILLYLIVIINLKIRTVLRAKYLKINYHNNILYVSDLIKSGISLDTYNPFQRVSYDYKISIGNVSGWRKDNRWYYITGTFVPIKTIDGISYESNEYKTRIRVPRCFVGEEDLENLLNEILKYNEI